MNEQNKNQAAARLDDFARLDLGFYPTPLEEMSRLREALGADCPRLFIKRDDYTGFGFGGNKIRKLEYLLADAVKNGAETIVTTGGERSNHARLTAAVCAKLGLRCVLVLDRKPRPAGAENLKPATIWIAETLGAEVYLVETIEERKKLAAEIVATMRGENVKVFEIPLGGALGRGALGFVAAMREFSAQARQIEVEFDHVFFASSTGGTHAGMLAGAEIFGLENARFVGVSPEPQAAAEIGAEVWQLLVETGELLEIPFDNLREKIIVLDKYAGAGYCVETAKANAALKLLAQSEAVFLDSVYTAKAMAGLLDWIEKKRLKKENNVLFWHTGGQPTLFYAPES